MIYLASPYTHKDPEVMNSRYLLTKQLTASLLSRNIPVFSPIVYGREFEHTLGHTFYDWKFFNDCVIRVCDLFVIHTLPGWRESKGVEYEWALFRSRSSTPVQFVTTEGIFSWVPPQ